jgi:hypothetical protein
VEVAGAATSMAVSSGTFVGISGFESLIESRFPDLQLMGNALISLSRKTTRFTAKLLKY